MIDTQALAGRREERSCRLGYLRLTDSAPVIHGARSWACLPSTAWM